MWTTKKMGYMLEVWTVGITTAAILFFLIWSLASFLTVASEREGALSRGHFVVTVEESVGMQK